MTDLQSDYLKMFIVVREIMDDSYETWKTNEKIVECVDELKNYIVEIDKCNTVSHSSKFALNAGAKALRTQLRIDAFAIKEALRLYYTYNIKEEEKSLFTFPISRFNNMRNNDFYLLVFDISQRAKALAGELEYLKITGQQISALAMNVKKYYKFLLDIEKTNETFKGATSDTAVLINDCRLMLRNRLDGLMTIHAMNHREVYELYKSSRRLLRSGGPKNYYTVIVSGKITMAKLQTPLSGVKIVPETKGKSAVTDKDGKFTLKIYKKYARSLNFALDGYEPAKFVFPEVVKEHKMEVNVQMEKKAEEQGGEEI